MVVLVENDKDDKITKNRRVDKNIRLGIVWIDKTSCAILPELPT